MVNLLAKYEEVFGGFGYVILFPICLFIFCMIVGLFRAIKQQGEKEGVNLFPCVGIGIFIYFIGKTCYPEYPYSGILAFVMYAICFQYERMKHPNRHRERKNRRNKGD